MPLRHPAMRVIRISKHPIFTVPCTRRALPLHMLDHLINTPAFSMTSNVTIGIVERDPSRHRQG